jgi:hypothetical protein
MRRPLRRCRVERRASRPLRASILVPDVSREQSELAGVSVSSHLSVISKQIVGIDTDHLMIFVVTPLHTGEERLESESLSKDSDPRVEHNT